ncbi:MAG: solute carrier family 23 protein [Pseudomonadota bacterium]
MSSSSVQAGYGIDDKPPHRTAALIGLQHLLAVFGGIVTAPLLIALGMQLDADETTYLISSALVVSGFATLVQIVRFRGIGSGMLSIQGTSFTFVTPLIFLYQMKANALPPDVVLGQIFTACLVCSLLMVVFAQAIDRLQRIITPAVAGSTVVLLGASLVWVALQGLQRDFDSYGLPALVSAAAAIATVALMAFSGRPTLRLASVVGGLIVGSLVAFALGLLTPPEVATASGLFIPELLRYPVALDIGMVLVLLPIFIVSATESVGDLSATAQLSGIRLRDRDFLRRLRGGVTADSLNSFFAAVFSTFPNTTFSQNNGVIRLTGVASRRVGLYTAAMLILIGVVPVVATVIQTLPSSVVGGATLIMFAMVGVSGWLMLGGTQIDRRTLVIASVAVIGGPVLSLIAGRISSVPTMLSTFLASPVSTGAFIAMLLELLIPRFTILEPAQ